MISTQNLDFRDLLLLPYMCEVLMQITGRRTAHYVGIGLTYFVLVPHINVNYNQANEAKKTIQSRQRFFPIAPLKIDGSA